MARRRFNTNFVIAAAVTAVALPVAGAVIYKLRPKDPQKFIAAGQQHERMGDPTGRDTRLRVRLDPAAGPTRNCT